MKNMLADSVDAFTELGPGTVLQGLIRKVNPDVAVESKATLYPRRTDSAFRQVPADGREDDPWGCLTNPISTISPLPEFILTGMISDLRDLSDSPFFVHRFARSQAAEGVLFCGRTTSVPTAVSSSCRIPGRRTPVRHFQSRQNEVRSKRLIHYSLSDRKYFLLKNS